MRHKYIVTHGIKIARDFVPETFGRLTTIGPKFQVGRYATKQVCSCVCGNVVVLIVGKVTCGDTRSCGCLNKEMASARLKTHGKSGTLEYRIWRGMLARCNNPNVRAYPDYGGRGIKVFPEWSPKKNDKGVGFLTFLDYMGECPADKNSIDRIDNDKGYEPGNVRWATKEEQANNKRSCLFLTHDNRTQTLSQWASEVGITRATIKARLNKGLTVEESLKHSKFTKKKKGNKA